MPAQINPTPIHDTSDRIHEDVSGLSIVTAQEIPSSFVSMLRQMKADSGSVKEKEFMHVGCIPAVFVHEYMKKGFNILEEPVRETCKRLIRDGLDSFVVTNKRV